MYTVSKGPGQIVQKTRRGLTEKLETCEVLQELTTSSRRAHGGNSNYYHKGQHQNGARMKSATTAGGGGATGKHGHGPRPHNHHHHGGGAGYIHKSPSAVPVFSSGGHGHPGAGGGGGGGGSGKARYHHRLSQEKVTPQQEEVVRYVYDKWLSVQKELDSSKQGGGGAAAGDGTAKITVYQEKEPNPKLSNFEPFDLESWWGKKLYQNLTQGP